MSSSNGHVPDGAVVAGSQSNGEPLFVGRGHYRGSITPGKIHKAHGCLYIGHSHGEHSIKQYEVLIGNAKCKYTFAIQHTQRYTLIHFVQIINRQLGCFSNT